MKGAMDAEALYLAAVTDVKNSVTNIKQEMARAEEMAKRGLDPEEQITQIHSLIENDYLPKARALGAGRLSPGDSGNVVPMHIRHAIEQGLVPEIFEPECEKLLQRIVPTYYAFSGQVGSLGIYIGGAEGDKLPEEVVRFLSNKAEQKAHVNTAKMYLKADDFPAANAHFDAAEEYAKEIGPIEAIKQRIQSLPSRAKMAAMDAKERAYNAMNEFIESLDEAYRNPDYPIWSPRWIY